MASLGFVRARTRGFRGVLLVSLLGGPLAAGEAAALQTAQTPPATGAQTAPAAPAESAKLSTDQLESLVAPLALYPDPLLAQCLVASTYPLDIVEAQQWLDKNSTLKGEALTKAAQEQSWDPSVQALVEIPDALKRLSENIEWTTDLGDAVLAQKEDVMNAVQSMRKKAKDGGKLETTKEQTVETTVVENKTVIEIQPSSTEVVYVPSYSPTVVWGAPYYPYPPMYYPPYYGGAWLGFGVGIAVGIGISGGWGWGCGWGDVDININNNNTFVNNSNRTKNTNRSGTSSWQHDAKQRGGAPYKDKATASKYGGGARGDSPQARTSQAQSRQGDRASTGSMDRGGSSGSRGGASAGSMDRGGASAGSMDRGGASAGSMDRGGSSSMGSRSVPSSSSSSRSSGGFSGGSGSSARSSSSRGHSSMGGSRGGGGGGRRR
ncbi:MAG TPA: DUF3300 domain-containing protein [Thermoanaerobaculia bacterium]|jgi:hypothetical protein